MERIRERLSYANVMSTLAVFLALGIGGAWALERNSVGSGTIKDGSIQGRDVRNQSLTGRDVNTKSLRLQEQVVAASVDTSCNPGAELTDCGLITATLPVSERVLIVAQGSVEADAGAAPHEVSCVFNVDGTTIAGPAIYGEAASGVDSGFGLTTVTEKLGAGAHAFRMACSDADADARLDNAQLSILGIRAR